MCNDVPSDAIAASILFDRLRAMQLPSGTYAVFGSGPLAIRGLIDTVGDLDIICLPETWERVSNTGTIVMYGRDETVDHGNGLTFGTSWAYGNFDIPGMIASAETIDGLPFVQLRHVVAYKRLSDRPKDRAHLALLGDAQTEDTQTQGTQTQGTQTQGTQTQGDVTDVAQ